MVGFREFENIIKEIDRDKYHICRKLAFTENGMPYLDEWAIFRKDMSMAEYFSKENLAVLSSAKGNTIEDIKNFIEEQKQCKD